MMLPSWYNLATAAMVIDLEMDAILITVLLLQWI